MSSEVIFLCSSSSSRCISFRSFSWCWSILTRCSFKPATRASPSFGSSFSTPFFLASSHTCSSSASSISSYVFWFGAFVGGRSGDGFVLNFSTSDEKCAGPFSSTSFVISWRRGSRTSLHAMSALYWAIFSLRSSRCS